ncbi:MAG: sigma-70 family RNA polymerase sigma factor [Acidobacteriia bacterium]|nr:sigma-70 family RNA polymerase sigma factor [Terriglobia bacterium]
MPENSHAITGLLLEWRSGDKNASARLMELVYRELHQMASRQMRRERGGHTLQTTALVHEAYMRLCGAEPIEWHDRAHFFAVAAQQLRRVLVDHARRFRSEKRGGGKSPGTLFDGNHAFLQIDERVLAVDEALAKLEALDARAAKVIELRFFGGLTESEAAAALDISITTLKRDWDFGRSWLAAQLD